MSEQEKTFLWIDCFLILNIKAGTHSGKFSDDRNGTEQICPRSPRKIFRSGSPQFDEKAKSFALVLRLMNDPGALMAQALYRQSL